MQASSVYWPAWALALVSALLANTLLSRLALPRWIYATLGSLSFLGGGAVIHYLKPWQSSTEWPAALQATLLGLAVGQFTLAFRTKQPGNAA